MFVAWFAGSAGAPVEIGYVAPAEIALDRSISVVMLAPGTPAEVGDALGRSGRFTVVGDAEDADAVVAWGPDGGRVVAADGRVVDAAPLSSWWTRFEWQLRQAFSVIVRLREPIKMGS